MDRVSSKAKIEVATQKHTTSIFAAEYPPAYNATPTSHPLVYSNPVMLILHLDLFAAEHRGIACIELKSISNPVAGIKLRS